MFDFILEFGDEKRKILIWDGKMWNFWTEICERGGILFKLQKKWQNFWKMDKFLITEKKFLIAKNLICEKGKFSNFGSEIETSNFDFRIKIWKFRTVIPEREGKIFV